MYKTVTNIVYINANTTTLNLIVNGLKPNLKMETVRVTLKTQYPTIGISIRNSY